MTHLSIERFNKDNLNLAMEFLKIHEETTQFLVTNFFDNGPKITEHPNSGNFYIVKSCSQIIGVFCLTRRGNLLVQCEEDATDAILDVCHNEPVDLKGFIGEWSSVEPLYKKFRLRNPDFVPFIESKEILYSFELNPKDHKIKSDDQVRLLTTDDFNNWDILNRSYMNELSIPNDLTPEQNIERFRTKIEQNVLWGLIVNNEIVSMAALNSKGKESGQVGGVFTLKEMRMKGFSKRTMLHVLKDCRDLHKHNKSILFTGENSISAQKLYESIGYSRIGNFGIIIG